MSKYGTNGDGSPHDFKEHVLHMLGEDALAPNQEQYGGYAWINGTTIVARSPITGLRPVIEQAIATIKKQNPNLTGEALENKIANQLTQLNDWNQLTTETQNEIQILTGINFDGMTAAEQEATINHLQHSPLPFGDIEEVLGENVTIDMGYTHTLDKTKTHAEHMGDGIYKVYMISNNNNGSHTGHNLGSFMIDLSDKTPPNLVGGLYATAASASSNYGNTQSHLVGKDDNKTWWPKAAQAGDVTVKLDFGQEVYAQAVELVAPRAYAIGTVTKVEAQDANGTWHTVWTGRQTSNTNDQDMVINFDKTDFKTDSVRVTLDTNANNRWEGIDAVKLVPAKDVGQKDYDDQAYIDLAISTGNGMVQNTNNNNKLYLDQAAKDVLYGRTEQLDFTDLEHHHGGNGGVGQGHHFYEHVEEMFGTEVLSDNQEKYGGWSWLNSSTIVARSSITGLKPVIEQAIATIKKQNPNLTGDALESKIANQLTQLNDWTQLTEETQAELMIITGYNFDGMTKDEREMLINHLLHSPVPFGEIEEVLGRNVTIDMGYTHTLDKTKTEAEHIGDGIFEVRMISNNNNGSHTGHNLGSFRIDLSNETPANLQGGQYASSAQATSSYNGTNGLVGNNNTVWWPKTTQAGDVDITLNFANEVYTNAVELHAPSGYPIGTVTKVQAQDASGTWHTVWSGRQTSNTRNDDMVISFDKTDFKTDSVRVTLDTNANNGWEGIHAVKLHSVSNGEKDFDDAAYANLAIQIGNGMVKNTNNNNKLYLNEAAKDILYGREEENDFDVDNPYGGGHGGGHHDKGEINGKAWVDADANGRQGAGEEAITDSYVYLYNDHGHEVQKVKTDANGYYKFENVADGTYYVGTEALPNGYKFTTKDVGNDNKDSDINPSTGRTDALTIHHGNTIANVGIGIAKTDTGGGNGNNEITGTSGDDHLVGTDANDTIKGGDGLDVMVGGKGDDYIDGEGGDYNQVDFLGSSSEYTFTRNSDGSITAEHDVYGTDTLLNIDGAWFYGDRIWRSMDDLVASGGGGNGNNEIIGTSGDDHLVGGAGDDIIKGGDGLDVMVGGLGDDYIDGEGGDYNQVDFLGSSDEYTFTRNSDGSITAEHDVYGTDTLKNIDGAWFYGDRIWSSMDDLVSNSGGGGNGGGTGTGLPRPTVQHQDKVNVAETLQGTLADDVYNVNRAYSHHTLEQVDANTWKVTHKHTGETDTLVEFDAIQFSDQLVDIENYDAEYQKEIYDYYDG